MQNRKLGDWIAVAVSVIVQVPLAIFLGHYYDQTIFLQTGYLVNEGLNPYQPNLISIFGNVHLNGVNNVIGYPPIWPCILGLIYHLTYNLSANVFLYNFATKIPIIASNIVLAYVTKQFMTKQNMPKRTVDAAWFILLFNPFTLLTTAAWGQIDTFIALLCVSAIYLLSLDSTEKSALLLAFSVVLKPISFALLGLPFFLPTKTRRNRVLVVLIVAGVVVLGVLPAYFLGWRLPLSPDNASSFFSMAGGLSLFSAVEPLTGSAVLPAGLASLGYLWIPALILGYYLLYRHPPKDTYELFRSAVFLLLVFFLTRTWVSEPNLNLLLPFLLIIYGYGKIGGRLLHLAWILPLLFVFFNYAFPQLFFLVYPPVISELGIVDLQFGAVRFAARFAVSALWFIVAVKLLFEAMKRNTARSQCLDCLCDFAKDRGFCERR